MTDREFRQRAALIALRVCGFGPGEEGAKQTAKACFRMADEMLRESKVNLDKYGRVREGVEEP